MNENNMTAELVEKINNVVYGYIASPEEAGEAFKKILERLREQNEKSE